MIKKLHVARMIDMHFYLRYWTGGPHIRLRVRPTRFSTTRGVETYLIGAVRDWCAANPSTRPMTSDEYTTLTTSLRRAADGAVEDLQPEGSIQQRDYLPETDRYGWGKALESCHRHFMESTNLAFELIDADTTHGQRKALITGLISSYIDDLPKEVRGNWQKQVLRVRSTSLRVSPRLLDTLVERGETALRPMRQSIEELAAELHSSAQYYTPPAVGFGGIRFFPSPSNAPYTTVDIALHLFSNRLGVTIPEELDIRAAVAQSICLDDNLKESDD